MYRTVITILVILLTVLIDSRSSNAQFISGTRFGPAESASPNCTPNVADLSSTTVQSAISGASAGSTVCLPAGNVTWTSTVTVATVAANVTVMGQTECTGVPASLNCTDNTVITNNVSGNGRLWDLGISATGVFRSSGITYQSIACSDDPFKLYPASGTYANARIDHNHWINFCNFNFVLSNIKGVADHNYYDNPGSGISTINQVRPFGADNDTEWTNATNFGSKDFNWFYLEDSRWNRGISNDCYSSGRQVFRYNYMNDVSVQQHGTGHSGQNRGCRAMEIYNNTFLAGTSSSNTMFGYYTGPAIVYSNAIGTAGYTSAIQYTETRQSDYTYTKLGHPTDFGYCGDFAAARSVWDGNTDSTGYPCLDQVGRGAGDLLSGDFSTKANSTRGCTVNFTWANRASNCDTTDSSAWPRQALEPAYEFLNTGTVTGTWSSVYRSPASSANIVENRDFYTSHNNTNCNAGAGSCTAGVGSGTLAQIPANCTTGVAYWATDTNGLYKCVSTNSWRWYYSPLTYPHPNVGQLPVNNYATNFPETENPIAEQNSVWIGGQDAGGNHWGNLRTTPGFVFGVSQPTSFGDPTAILKGTWGATQGAQANVSINSGGPPTEGEVEIRLRSTISTNSNTGYEAYCSVVAGNPYCHIATWGGPEGCYDNIEASTPSIALVDGDTLSATVTGTSTVTIKLYVNGIVQATATDSGTHTPEGGPGTCSAGDSYSWGQWTSGSPGLGFFDRADTLWSRFGFSKFSAIGQ